MNKTELIAAVASKCSISKKEAEAVVLATFDSITNAKKLKSLPASPPLSRPARLSRKLSTKPYLSLLT